MNYVTLPVKIISGFLLLWGWVWTPYAYKALYFVKLEVRHWVRCPAFYDSLDVFSSLSFSYFPQFLHPQINFWKKSRYFLHSSLDLFQFLTMAHKAFPGLSFHSPASSVYSRQTGPSSRSKSVFLPRAFALTLPSTHDLSLDICMAHFFSLFPSFIKCHLCREVFQCRCALSPCVCSLYLLSRPDIIAFICPFVYFVSLMLQCMKADIFILCMIPAVWTVSGPYGHSINFCWRNWFFMAQLGYCVC